MSVDLLVEESFEDLEMPVKSAKIQEMLKNLHASRSSMQEQEIATQEMRIYDLLTKAIKDARSTGFRAIGTELCRLTIREYMPWIYRNLNSGKHSVIQANLRLLVALVMHGQSTTKELLDCFNFTLKPLNGFLRIRKRSNSEGKSTEDIRSLYIKFLLGFIIRGDSLVKKAILEMKNLLSLIFKDMSKDSYQVISIFDCQMIEFVFETFKKGIIEDQRLSRSTKLSYFNHTILTQIVSLFEESKENTDAVLENSIPELTLQFMRALCVTPGQGVCFYDSGWCESKLNNSILSKLLKSLKVVDIRQRKLFLEILTSCPELVSHFWDNSSHLSFEPRSSVFYLSNISLASEVINIKIPEYFGVKIDESTTFVAPPLINVTIANILPEPLGKSSASRALQSAARDVRFACGKLLSFSFLKLKKVLDMAKKVQDAVRHRINGADLQQLETVWNEWESNLVLEFRLLLPDPQIIIALQKSSKQEPTAEDSEITVEDLIVSYLELLKLYQIYNPYQMRETRYDFGKLLADITDSTNPVKIEILEIIGNVYDFKYWTVPKGGSQTYLHILLCAFLQADDFLKPKVKAVLESVVENSFGFRSHQSGLLWDILLHFKHEGDSIVKFINETLVNNVKSPFMLVDDMLAFVRKSGFDESDYPFAPIHLQLLRDLLSNGDGSVKIYVCAIIVQDCLSRGYVVCSSYQQALDFIMDDAQLDNISQSLYNWLCSSKSVTSDESANWKTGNLLPYF
jgi:Ribosome 60S biogenesis N-terminal